jgi:cell division protein FtsA
VDVVRNPIHATGVGLLLYGKQGLSSGQTDMSSSGKMQSVWERMKNWFQGNF